MGEEKMDHHKGGEGTIRGNVYDPIGIVEADV